LLLAFAILLFRVAPFYWGLILTAFLGYLKIRVWHKRGLLFSYPALCVVSFLILRSGQDTLWASVLIASIALSWLLIYWGGLEVKEFAQKKEEKILALAKELEDTKAILSKEQWHFASEKQQWATQTTKDTHALSQLMRSLQELRYEKEMAEQKSERLSTEFFSSERQQSGEKAQLLESLQALREEKEWANQKWEGVYSELCTAQDQLKQSREHIQRLNEQLSALTENKDETTTLEEKQRIEQVQCQLALLREQFEEKSEMLHLARKELFRAENDLLIVQKGLDEKMLQPSEEASVHLRDLKSWEEETQNLSDHAEVLQDLVSSLLIIKKIPQPKKRKKTEKEESLLPGILQKKIDKKRSSAKAR
jgi:hypothetical protein